MNKNQKQIIQQQLNDEKAILNELKKTYKTAIDDIDQKISDLMARTDTENIQSIIYQVDYQKALKKQVSGILDDLNTKQFNSISEYLTACYETGYIGTMYDLKGQGIPIITPIDQEQITKAIVHDTKLSESLYDTLGYNVSDLKKQISSEISRGLSTALSYTDIARNVSNRAGVTMNQSMRIARTEGHRITQQATYNAQQIAKDAGADVVKQWDASLDSRTRPHHSQLDGQLRELDEDFDVAGRKALYPGGFGVAAEDINCRCVLLQRAKWALDEEELETLKQRAEYFGLDKSVDFEDFKKQYIKAVGTDPNEGKVFHMKPDGTLEEGDIPGKDKYYLNGLTDEVTELDKGIDYTKAIFSLNDDGTYSFGKVKNAAQYKIDIPNNQIIDLDVNTKNIPSEFKTEWDNLVKKGTNADEAFIQVIKNKGYKGINYIDYSGNGDDFFTLLDDSLATKTKKSKFETLSINLNKQQKKLNKIDNKTYTGIWKEDVQVSDYSSKKTSIQAKQHFYTDQIIKYSGDAYTNSAWAPNEIAKYQKYLNDLDEFEKLGKEYEQISDKIKKIQTDIKKYTPKTSVGDAFTQDRKDNAYWFTDKNGSIKAADEKYRSKSGEVWKNASKVEKKSIYDYTRSYSKFNEPLRGIEYGTNKYLGVGNVDLNQIGVNGYGNFKLGEVKKEIDAMTSIIDKSSYDFDIWLQRGVSYNNMDKFFGIDPNDFYLSESELAAKLIDTTPTEYGFMSTGAAKGKGFSGRIIMNIYAPEGTKMMYVEPFSAFGNGAGQSWNGVDKQSSFGSEAEMILQRGTQFRVTKVEKNNGQWYIDMEIIGQGVT